ncbi:MAG: CGGC domain-containing protein [Thermoplasmata archaeon]|nr:CGGC domain-containing protein [Thermoplasmatales archaeon]
MKDVVKIGIIICDRYRNCAGGKCFRSLRKKEGAFSIYGDKEIEVVGYTTCGGCPGGNIEYAPEEMKKNGVEVIHFATGLVVGYPPCPYIDYFKKYIEEKFGIKVVIGTHPVPQKYYTMHEKLGTWKDKGWEERLKYVICDEKIRKEYD